jgi:DNA primase
MGELLSAALPLSEVFWRQLVAEHPGETPERRAALEKAAEAKARLINDGTVQNQYRRMFRDRLFQHFRPAPRQPAGGRPGVHQGQFTRGRPHFRGPNPVRGAYLVPPGAAPPMPGPDSGARMRERILLATLISHPQLFDYVEERLGAMTFSDARLDLLRQTAVMHIAQSPELDFAALSAQLSAHGYAAEVATLLHPEVYQHAGFARPQADLDQATAGWDRTFAVCQKAVLEAHLERAEQELVENPSDEALAIRDALLHQMHSFLADDD